MINLTFPRPKDPADVAWYLLRAPEPVASILGITAVESAPPDLDLEGSYTTAGDVLTGSNLIASSPSIPSGDVTTSDGQVVPAGYGIAFQLSGGKPATSYAVRASFITVSGSTLNRSSILLVTGQ
jgi:hypothetical protein